MKTVRIRHLSIGEGMPRTCVPIVGKSTEDIRRALDEIQRCRRLPDLVEFRADWLESQAHADRALELIRRELGELPVLFTFRTAREGGERQLAYGEYRELLRHVAAGGLVDAADVEAFSYVGGVDGACAGETEPSEVERLVRELQECGCAVIGSNHDFQATPCRAEMVARLHRMRELGVDIAKLAVMPNGVRDVLELLSATAEAAADEAMCPVITMSMAGQGVISRLSGEVFGSAVTFASAGRASAPGQMELDKLQDILDAIHESGG